MPPAAAVPGARDATSLRSRAILETPMMAPASSRIGEIVRVTGNDRAVLALPLRLKMDHPLAAADAGEDPGFLIEPVRRDDQR